MVNASPSPHPPLLELAPPPLEPPLPPPLAPAVSHTMALLKQPGANAAAPLGLGLWSVPLVRSPSSDPAAVFNPYFLRILLLQTPDLLLAMRTQLDAILPLAFPQSILIAPPLVRYFLKLLLSLCTSAGSVIPLLL